MRNNRSGAQRPAQVDFTLHPQSAPHLRSCCWGGRPRWRGCRVGRPRCCSQALLSRLPQLRLLLLHLLLPLLPLLLLLLQTTAHGGLQSQGRVAEERGPRQHEQQWRRRRQRQRERGRTEVGDGPAHLLPLPQRLAQLGPRQGLLGTHHRHGERPHGCRRWGAREKMR